MKAVRRYQSYGRVQGVGYRQFVLDMARELQLCGTVRNLQDGTVETLIQGPETVWEYLETRLRTGPPFSQVTDLTCVVYSSLEEVPEQAEVDWRGFKIVW